MLHFTPILADVDELVYVIAVLILSVAGAVFEKVKQKMAGNEQKRPDREPRVPGDLSLPRPWIGEAPPTSEEPQRPPAKPRPERMPPPVPGKRSTAQPPPVTRPSKPPAPRPRPPVVRVPQTRDESDIPPPERPRRPEVPPPPRKPPRESPLAPAAELIFEAMRVARPAEIVSPQAVQRVQEIRTITAPTPQVSAYPAKSFRQMNAAEWRRAIILTEVLGPPVALRESQGLEANQWT